MALLITGGTGFLGSHIARRLLRESDDKIIILDAYPNLNAIADIADRVELVRGDFSEMTELLPVLKKDEISHIFHLAYLTQEADKFPAQALRINILGTNNLFEAAIQFGVKKIIFASSGAIFRIGRGPRHTDQLMHEEDKPTPTTFYGMCKLANEINADLHFRRSALQYAGLRLQSIFGPGRGQRKGVAPDVMSAVIELPLRGECYVTPSAESLLSWTYVEDVAEAFYLAHKAHETPHRIFNVTGEVRPMRDAVAYVKSIIPGAALETGDQRPTTMPLASPDRAREELGFVARYSMEQGLSAYLERLKAAAG